MLSLNYKLCQMDFEHFFCSYCSVTNFKLRAISLFCSINFAYIACHGRRKRRSRLTKVGMKGDLIVKLKRFSN